MAVADSREADWVGLGCGNEALKLLDQVDACRIEVGAVLDGALLSDVLCRAASVDIVV